MISAGFPLCLFIRNSVKVDSFRISWILINSYYCFPALRLSLSTLFRIMERVSQRLVLRENKIKTVDDTALRFYVELLYVDFSHNR